MNTVLSDAGSPADTSAQPVLELRDLHVWFRADDGDEIETVKGINVSLAPGERLGLVGESGCGKTTTILAALGLLPSNASVAGQVLFEGVDILSGGEKGFRKHRWCDIAMVFQGAMSAFNPVKTIEWQIEEALKQHGRTQGMRERIVELISLVGLPEGTEKRYPHELSGGMKQRAVIAMALSCEPKVLLADEPTTALDVVVQDQILRLLVELSERLGLAVILVTHDLGVVAQSCSRAAVMYSGEIVELDTVERLYRDPATPYTRQLFESTPDIASVATDAAAEHAAQCAPDRSPRHATGEAPLLRVEDLRVEYPGKKAKAAVKGISFEVGRGELVALVGQSGCGKTTILQSVMGLVKHANGSIELEGEQVLGARRRALRTLRSKMQPIFQDPYESLDMRFTVGDTIEEPLLIHRVGGDQDARRALVLAALESVGLSPAERFVDRYPHQLSGGQRQRVAIASGLVLGPSLLLADEPVSMLDVSVRTGVLALLKELKTERHVGILMITHDLSTAAAYADRIIVMREGAFVEMGTPNEVTHHPREEYTKLLIDSIPSPDPARR